MKKFTTPIFLVLFTTCTFAQTDGGWSVTTSPDAVRYDDVFFLNKNIGWTAGGNNARVHKTIDGGLTWELSGPAGNTQYLRSIEFMDENIGLCGSFAGIGKAASLYRTTDGGQTWTNIADQVPAVEGFCGLAKASESVVYGVGVWSEPAYVIKSTDKGLNWTFKDMSAYASSLIDAYFFDADHGFVTGSKSAEVNGVMTVTGGVILYTEDGGETWTEKFHTDHVSDRVWKIQTPDNKHFYGSIEADLGSTTRMLRSEDAGQTWEMITVDNNYFYIQMIGFIDSLRGWTGGNETLFETKDGGDTWAKIPLGSTYNRFFKINEELAFMTGRKVYKFERDVITGVGDPQKYDPIHRMTVSPNPTNGKAEVRITFGNPTMAHVNVFSAAGTFVKRIYDGTVVAGEKLLDLDLTSYGSQTYLIVVNTNEGMIRSKILKR